ncbi:E3 ubiquitin-protein ligase TRIM39-like [Xyrichtys novacula]|uniref:E3 ubiquitin-protein ligase TRIM39-like n=1 Tax=Xyrichtys novacula TaxID=13765 RepID=A0AAV1FXC8_XYRNO|nr:E3 ubiquitin-protein ligase TRIM39-like [Xyrichtys novacula]
MARGLIPRYWATCSSCQSPLCKEDFPKPPDLHVNIEFRDMLELFKKQSHTVNVKSSRPREGEVEVLCSLCDGTRHKADKSCLICLASYCKNHLKPHSSVQALRWHKLINPMQTLEDRLCKIHNKILEFFCKTDQSCVCALRLKNHLGMHEVVSLEDRLKDRKTKLSHAKTEVKRNLNEKRLLVQNSITQCHGELQRSKVETGKALDALVALIVTKKMTLIELLEGKQRAAEQQAKTFIRQLQLEITEDTQRYTELEELSKTSSKTSHPCPSL